MSTATAPSFSTAGAAGVADFLRNSPIGNHSQTQLVVGLIGLVSEDNFTNANVQFSRVNRQVHCQGPERIHRRTSLEVQLRAITEALGAQGHVLSPDVCSVGANNAEATNWL